MVCKVIAITLFVACTQAIRYDGHDATSSIVFNDNHNSIHHIQSPYAAPSHGYAAPSHVNAAPASYYSHSAPVTQYAAPVVKVAAPVLLKSVAPASNQGHASSYSSLNFGQGSQYEAPSHGNAATGSYYSHAAPVTQYAAPVVKVAAPILLKAAAPAYSQGHASSYSSLNFGQGSQYEAPAHYAAPAVAPVTEVASDAAYHGGSYSYAAPAVAKFVAPVAKVVAAPAYNNYHHEEESAPAKYEFAYGVEDHHTGDIHSHKESRDGDVTHGEYSLHEADGTIRTVKYSVDKHSGFNAVVERSGHANHAQPAKAFVAAPVVKAVAAPASYYHH